MHNFLIIIFSIISVLTGYILKKVKKQEIIKVAPKYYYLIVIFLTIITAVMPLSLLKKCCILLTVAPLTYQMFMDFETFELSDILSGYLFLIGLAYTLISGQYNHFGTAFILTAIYVVMSLLGPMGFGDVKLVVGLGLFLHRYTSLLLYPFLFAVIGELVTRIFVKKEDSSFAFGPYIILGFYVAVFFLEKTI